MFCSRMGNGIPITCTTTYQKWTGQPIHLAGSKNPLPLGMGSVKDDFMFCKVMQNNPDLCKHLIELIIGKKITMITEDMIALMSYLRGEMIKRNSFIEDLDAAVKRAREKEDWKVEYMALSLKFQDAMEEGRAEGRAEMQQNIVIKLLSANQFSDKAICSIVDISEEKLEEYKKMYMEQNEKK